MRKHMSSYKRNSPMKETTSAGAILGTSKFETFDPNWKPEITPIGTDVIQSYASAAANQIANKTGLTVGSDKIESSANAAPLASDPRGGAVDVFSNYDLRSAWKGAKMAARKEAQASRKAGVDKETIKAKKAERLTEASKKLAEISGRQIEEQVNPRLTSRVKSPAMKMIFKK